MCFDCPMANFNDFCSNYMVLRPEEVDAIDLFRRLWSYPSGKCAFQECTGGKEMHFRNRWIIFWSLSAQKVLLSAAGLLSSFGSWFEYWLNLVSHNHSLFTLISNFFKGQVIKPDRRSERFISVIGHLDKRVELDPSIKLGDVRYCAALSAMAAKVAYENKAFVEDIVQHHWKMEVLGYNDFWNGNSKSLPSLDSITDDNISFPIYIDFQTLQIVGLINDLLNCVTADFQEKHTTQGFILHDKVSDPNIVLVAFRGTEPFDADAWCTDIDMSWYEQPGAGKVHSGFMKALGMIRCQGWPKEIEKDEEHALAYYDIREKLRECIQRNSKTKIILTGHSMGGALAILFPAVLAFHEETWLLDRIEGVYTFGQPRVGDEEFKIFMENLLKKHGIRYLRFVYCNDAIPRLPLDDSVMFSFKHFGTCLYYNSFYKGKRVKEEPHKNFFGFLNWIPVLLNSVWELVRSFIIPYTRGPDYAEGWLMKFVRLTGLFFPGIASHSPRDYVNITRLGSPDLYYQLQDYS